MADERHPFTREFKAEAVKLVTEQGRSVAEAARTLGIGENLLRAWMIAFQDQAGVAVLTLTVIAGPHQGKEFTFDGHDTFLVGRVNDAHLQLSYDDPYFSRRHFVVEVNPPRCRVLDLKSRNGTHVNGARVTACDLKDGDEIAAGHTVFKVSIVSPSPAEQKTLAPLSPPVDQTVDHVPAAIHLPGYAIGPELGRGGMGVVYRARRLADGRDVAIKTITPAVGVSARQVGRFLREAGILAQLRHPNIVGFTELGDTGSVIFLAMELVVGPDCAKVLAEHGPMPTRTAVRLLCQVLKGLAHAHEMGFVHRDIKPPNILIAAGEANKRTAKLADFGLARVYESSRLSGLTMQGEIGGTPAFMAPEQVTHYRDVKPAADQYSAAATLYKLLTDQHVHDLPRGMEQQLITITMEDPVPIRERRGDIPRGLAKVIHKALSREPRDRYRDVGAFREALKEFG